MKTIIVVGVGALGSHVVQFLRNEAAISIVDFDHVESKNTLSQFHNKMSLNKLKVDSLRGAVKLFWNTNLTINSNKVVDGNVERIIGQHDLVIDCLDNAAGRHVIQRFTHENHRPCLHGALAADGAFGRSCWNKDFVIDDEAGAGAATCEGGEHLPFIAIVGGYIARSAQIFLRTGRQVGFEISPAGAIST